MSVSGPATADVRPPALVVIDTGVCPSQYGDKDAPLAPAFISEILNESHGAAKSGGVLCEDVSDPAAPMRDEHGHGTHLCGILWEELTALDGNEKPEPSLVMLKAGARKMAGYDLLRAVRRTRQLADGTLRVRVLLCAFNLYPDDCEPREFDAFAEGLRKLMDDGVWVVAAAGNRGVDLDEVEGRASSLPACLDHPNCLVVASANGRGLLAARSNFGVETVWIAGPGARIESLWPGGGRKALSGSSQAAAVVAARLFHEAREHPEAELPEILKRIETGAKRHPSLLQTVRSGRFLSRAGGVKSKK